ncbi:MAG: hypothetical protein ABH878_04770 [bacterium]
MDANKIKALKERWRIRAETGEELDNIAPEEQLEYFHQGADEALKELRRTSQQQNHAARLLAARQKLNRSTD